MHRFAPLVVALLTLTVASAGAAEELTWRFNADGDLRGWTPENFERVEVAGGMLRGVTQYDCMLTSPELAIDADELTVVEFRVASTVTDGGEIFWRHADDGFAPERKRRHVVYASDEPRVYRSPVGEVETWGGTIRRIRLDILNAAGAEIALDYVGLTTQPVGVVPNSGFEDDFDADGVPDGWTIDAAESEWSAEHTAQGDRCLMVATAPPDHRIATASVRVPLDRTGIYALDATVTHTEGRVRSLSAELRFFDVFGRPLDDGHASVETTTDEKGRDHVAGEVEVPPLAAYAELTLSVAGGRARVWWDAVELRHVAETLAPCERQLEGWDARWIWAPESVGEDDASAYFRRAFTLEVPPERITSARAQVTADDSFRMWVNGEEVGSDEEPDGWETPEMIDLRPHLVRGRNVIAIAARNVARAEGLLAEVGVVWPAGSVLLTTDETWKASTDAPEGWQATDFDASDWSDAEVIAAAGDEPWGALPHEHLGPREEIELVAVDAPAQLSAGDPLTVSATLSALPWTAQTNPLRLSLMRGEREVLCRARPTSQVAEEVEGGVRLGPITVDTSRFLAPADYEIALGYPGTHYAGRDGITIGALKVRPPARAEERPEVTVREHNGIPTLFIQDRPNPFMHYQELEVSRRRITNMADAGVHVYFLRADDIGWQGPDRYDYTDWDAKVVRLLNHDPAALVIPAFTISGRHQQWWLDENPDELARTASGSDQVGIYHHAGRAISLASQQWRTESGAAIERFVAHCRATSYAGGIVGYLCASGVSWEWQHWGSVGDHEPTDYSRPMQEAFRAWLRERYEDEAALQQAWDAPDATFEGARIPSVEQRDGASHMLLRDPRRDRYVIDFYLFYQDVIADGILHYLQIIKDASEDEALAGTYYGYVVTMLGGARRAGDSGHMALSRLLASDLCDFLISPWDYAHRAVGQPTTIMSAVGSVQVNGKLWAMETDLRTHLVEDERQRRFGAPDHLDGTVSQLRRAFASAATKGLAVRWYDFSNGWISGDPRQTQVIGRLREVADRWLTWDRSPDPDGIAVVVDEGTPAAYLSHEIEAMQWLVYRQKAAFERVGAPWSIYLLDDVAAGRVPQHRAYFFLNCFHMTREERAAIDALKSDGRTLVWFYAPGYIDEDLSVERISRLTDMRFHEVQQMRRWAIDLVEGAAWTEGITPAENEQPGIEIGPVFYPEEEGIDVLGRWREGDWPGLAVADLETHTSVYSAGPILSPRLLKRICRDAGVPVRVDGIEPSYVSRNLIGLHAAVPRTETLRFDEPTRVIDLTTGEILAAACTELHVEVPGPGTRLLHTVSAY